MRRLKIITLMVLIILIVSAFGRATVPAAAKSEDQVLHFVAYVCNKSYDEQWVPYDGGVIWQIRNMLNENVIYEETDQGLSLYSIATKFLWLDITFDENWNIINAEGGGYNDLGLVKGNGGWEGMSILQGSSETGTLNGYGSLGGRTMTIEAVNFTTEPPADGPAQCEGHGTYIDVGLFTGTIAAKKNK